ncbi:dihydrofolate reductase [Marinimicrobium sp. ARAG 43.8]|uniref:dihydrofolate reductase n=1 Tax=Marinimicrobium sp. ARAG 43.8 TaxID=3418719 RepID=UPI003CF12C65
MNVALIVAAASNGVIGRNNQLPWRLPGDMKYFKEVTMGKPVIMGRKTHESIGKPLPGRLNIVVSRSLHRSQDSNLRWVTSVEEALALARREEPLAIEIMVMGGEQIYRQSLPLADRVYLTRINLEVEGDAWFPELDPDQWRLESEHPGEASAAVAHTFQRFERITT